MSLKTKDIAQTLGISSATVSLALNNKPGVSEITKQKIFQMVHDLGYTELLPDTSNKNNIIQFIIYKSSTVIVSETPFFFQLMEGIQMRCKHYGHSLMVSYINEYTNTVEQITSIIDKNCAGIILLATEMTTEDLVPFSNISLPLVILDGYFESAKRDCIVINNTQGAYEATEYLIKNGHTQIGYLKSNIRIKNFQARYQGFEKALDSNKLTLNTQFVFKLGSSTETTCVAMRKYLNSHRTMPSAFFAENDMIALGVIKALKEYGYRIPEDISVIGFDNTPLAEVIEPELTTIHVPKQRLGVLAVDRLITCIKESPEEYIKLEIGTTLIKRNSVKDLQNL